MTTDEKMQVERQILYLLLNSRDAVRDFMSSPYRAAHFDDTHKRLLRAILDANDKNVMLTRLSFRDYCENLKIGHEIIAEENLFNVVSLVPHIQRDDLPMLLKRLHESFLSSKSIELIEDFHRACEKHNIADATHSLYSKLGKVINEVDGKAEAHFDIVGSPDFTNQWKSDFDNRFNPNAVIECGMKEIDDIMGRGFSAGDMTLICADVGSYKSTLMMNIAIGVFEQSKVDVLFIPLEMPRNAVFDKMLSRESKVPFKKIQKPVDPKTRKLLITEEEKAKVIAAADKWNSLSNHFAFLEMGDRTTVRAIRHQIEQRIAIHQPRLIVIDYVANLLPEVRLKDGNHLEIGNMLKDMLVMSRPGALTAHGFHILTAVQLNRSALTRMKNQRDQTKQVLGSEDLMGSHHYSMDAATIFGILKDAANPGQIQVIPMKSRYGETTYGDGTNKAVLRVKPELSMIGSDSAMWDASNEGDILAVWNKGPVVMPTTPVSAPELPPSTDASEFISVKDIVSSGMDVDQGEW